MKQPFRYWFIILATLFSLSASAQSLRPHDPFGYEGVYEGFSSNGAVCRITVNNYHTGYWSGGDDARTLYLYDYALEIGGVAVPTFGSRGSLGASSSNLPAFKTYPNILVEVVGKTKFDSILNRETYLKETMIFGAADGIQLGKLKLSSVRDILEYTPDGNTHVVRSETVNDVSCGDLVRIK